MKANKNTEYLIIIINVGPASHATKKHDSEFFDKMKLVAKNLIERKIFLRPNDDIRLIFMGSDVTNNIDDLDDVEALDVTAPCWNQIRVIQNLRCTDKIVDWISVMEMAINYVEREAADYTSKSIALLSDFDESSDVTRSDIKKIGDKLKDIRFLWIGKELGTEDELSIDETSNVLNICKQINGQYITIEDAMTDLKIYERPATKAFPWKCVMNVYGIDIPIVAYVKVKKEYKFPSWQLVAKEADATEETSELTRIKRVRKYLNKHRTEYNVQDTVTGYTYGDKSIPFTKEDESIMMYDSGPKSFIVYSFVKRQEVGIENWGGDGVRVVLPENENASKIFRALVRSMINEDVVAIVRKVWRVNSIPKMVILFPRAEVPGESWCFVEVELPYSEDRRSIESGSLKSLSRQLSKKQEGAIDNLLSSILLNSEDPVYLPGCVANPAIQHRWNALANRALHPRETLSPVNENLLEFSKRSHSVETKITEPLSQLEELFKLKEANQLKEEKQ